MGRMRKRGKEGGGEENEGGMRIKFIVEEREGRKGGNS